MKCGKITERTGKTYKYKLRRAATGWEAKREGRSNGRENYWLKMDAADSAHLEDALRRHHYLTATGGIRAQIYDDGADQRYTREMKW